MGDGHKSLREEVQLQQQALSPITTHVDELLIELRTELPRLSQENTAHKVGMERINELLQGGKARMDTFEKNLGKEGDSRIAGEKAVLTDFHERMVKDEERITSQVTELRERFEELSRRENEAGDKLKEMCDCVEHMSKATSEAQETVEQFGKRMLDLQEQSSQQTADIERQIMELKMGLQGWTEGKLLESETGLHTWVEAAAINRVNQVDRTLRKEMTERSAAIQQVLDRVANNAERWGQLQSKFDELLMEVHKADKVQDAGT